MRVRIRCLQVFSIILAAAVLSSCQAPGKAFADLSKHDVVGSETKSAPSDSWRKSRDCAAQAKKTTGKDNSGKHLSEDRVSHYSPKYDRCFVRLVDAAGFFGKSASTLLLDAFEGSIGATVPVTGPCYVRGREADCAKAEEFIADAMTN